MQPQLTYQDVRRAAQDALSSLQSVLGDLRTTIQSVKNDTATIGDLHNRTAMVERGTMNMQGLQQRVDNHTAAVQDVLNAMQQLHQAHNNLQQRVANVEQLVATMSAFVGEMHDVLMQNREQVETDRS